MATDRNGANLGKAKLHGASLVGADLSASVKQKTKLEGADLLTFLQKMEEQYETLFLYLKAAV